MWRFIIFAGFIQIMSSVRQTPGPHHPATKGEVWPKPQSQIRKNVYYKVLKPYLKFNVTKKPNGTCDILDEAITRYLLDFKTKFTYISKPENDTEKLDPNKKFFKGPFNRNLSIEFLKCEEYPSLNMDESYHLLIGDKNLLSSVTIWGILRGLETLSQLFYYNDDYTELLVNATMIRDYPAYKHRGLLIDTGRHYLLKSTILKTIDALAINKMNVLHWHMVDDESFPYQSEVLPELSKKGAFHQSLVYTKSDIKDIIEHARFRGVRIIPEFDIPGHVRSWGASHPELLTKCYKTKKGLFYGPLNPIRNTTYNLLRKLYKEVITWFPDDHLHIGGDEVFLKCWEINKRTSGYMRKYKLDSQKLHGKFMKKVMLSLPTDVKPIVWQEVFDSNVRLPQSTIVQVWKYVWIKEMDKILRAGNRVIFSSSWYLDYVNETWPTFYRDDPRKMIFDMRLSSNGLENIIGGEACMWGEMVDDTNIISRIWPRTSAVAERLWAGPNYSDSTDQVTNVVHSRLEEHVCRMKRRGISASPANGPGFCLVHLQSN